MAKNPENIGELFKQWEDEARLAYYKAISKQVREIYGDTERFKDLVYKSNPLLEIIKKTEEKP